MQTGTRRAQVVGMLIVGFLPFSVAQAQLGDMLKQGGSTGSGGLGNLGGMGGALSGESLTSSSTGMARSVLETMATPESSFLVSDYWAQGVHRPAEFAEEQRELLYRLENQRTSNREADVRPIRTVHVRWGMIRLGTKFLLHRREDKFRRDVGGYVLPGGRQNLDDLPIVDRKPESLRDLFRIDSVMARSSQEATLERELREELGLTPIDYEAGFLRTLEPFKKVEGTGNNHSFTQYDIAMYSVRLTAQGEMKLLDRVASKSAEWEWFSTSELLAGKLSDGKRAFIDALLRLPSGDLKQFLSKGIPDSSGTPPAYRTKGESIELPSAVSEPLLIGDAVRWYLVSHQPAKRKQAGREKSKT